MCSSDLQSEHGRNDASQDQRLCHCERELRDCQRQAASGDGNNRRAQQASATMVGPKASIQRYEKREYVNSQRKHQPADHAETSSVEEESESYHGGGSMLHRGNGRAFHHHSAGLNLQSKRGGVAAMQLRLVVAEIEGGYLLPNFQTEIPRRFALSARLS